MVEGFLVLLYELYYFCCVVPEFFSYGSGVWSYGIGEVEIIKGYFFYVCLVLDEG